MKGILNSTVLNFIFFSYVFNATWEWSQSPFFIDVTSDLNSIVWYRIHCSLGDTLILVIGFILVSLLKKGTNWIHHLKLEDYLGLALLGIAYTVVSEYINVYVKGNWSYSAYMPLVPFIGVGIVPLLQWGFLPPVILFVTKRQITSMG